MCARVTGVDYHCCELALEKCIIFRGKKKNDVHLPTITSVNMEQHRSSNKQGGAETKGRLRSSMWIARFLNIAGNWQAVARSVVIVWTS